MNKGQIRETALDIKAKGITKVALIGVFSPLDYAGLYEERYREIILQITPDINIVYSYAIGGVGLLERENATILNALILAIT